MKATQKSGVWPRIFRRIRALLCFMALQTLLSACTSTDSTRGHSMPVSHRAKENPDCSGSLSEIEKEQIRLHELKPGGPFSTVRGDFTQPGPLVFVGSFPPNTKIPTHYHNADEVLLIVSGSTYVGMYTGGMDGKPKEEVAAGTLYRAGDKHFLPFKTAHWLITTDTAVVFKACTAGPYKVTFLDQKP